MLVCIYEDRPLQVPGLKLLVLSLSRHCPTWPILVRFPRMGEHLEKWLGSFRNVTVSKEPLAVSGSYNVKPTVLLDGLSIDKECIWLDTDVLVNGDLAPLVRVSWETLIATQDPWEYASGSTHRCGTWGLPAGRDLPGPLNSAFLRVSTHHQTLLSTWQRLLGRQVYLSEQGKPVRERNAHMLSDQDALSAIAASLDFSDVPVRRLQHSAEIMQHHGAGAYGLSQRYTNLRNGLPPLLHAMGTVKPWRAPNHPKLLGDFRNYYERTYLELSPYVHLARRYRALLGEDADWMDLHTVAARMSSVITMGNPCFKGMAQALAHRALHYARTTLGRG
jgi:hypothetical protein